MTVPSFNIQPGESSESLALKRRYALELLKGGMDTSPVRHWTQGAARAMQAALGGYELYKAEKDEKDETAKGNALLAALFQGGGTTPATPAAAPVAPATHSAPPNVAGKIYENNEPSPLDPPSGKDRDLLIRTVLAEAGNQGATGQQAVASVIRNRAAAGNFGGDTVPGVIQKPYQFEPHNTAAGRARMAAIDPNSPQYKAAGDAVELAYAGEDPTRGATHFYSPKTQALLGRPAPAWDNGTGVDIKDHRFFGGAGAQPVTAGASPVQVAQASPGTPNREAIIKLLGNRKTAPIAQSIIAGQIQQQFKPTEYEFQKDENGSVIAINKRDPSQFKVVNPIDPQTVANKEGLKKLATERAEAQVKREAEAPQAEARARSTIQAMFKTGQEAQRLSTHPGLSSATGPIQGRLPTLRDDPANFEADVGTLGTKIFINTINQMRELSKTGGAVGSVTEKEMMKLENAMRSLSLTQGDKNMSGNLNKIVTDINDSMQSIADAYKQQYGKEMPFDRIKVEDIAPKGAAPKQRSLNDLLKQYGG